MKRANYGLFLPIISLIIVVAGCVFATGCVSSALGGGGMPDACDNGVQPSAYAFPPMYSFPKDASSVPVSGGPGKFLPGDILAPEQSSPVFDPDLAVVIVRDTGDGSYEIDGIARSGGKWERMTDSVRGTISYSEVERLFPDKVGHVDISMHAPGPGS
ncbi:MAG TPA: hypothetical protein VMC42_07465 [Methanoregulaceae archaeon]|nr:hypothetical protein [Methanoregulaceae archaeon]